MVQGILQTPCWLQYPSWGLDCQAVWEACREQPLYSQSNLNLFPSPRSGFRLPPNPQPGQSPVPFHLFHCLFFLLPSQTWNKQILTLQYFTLPKMFHRSDTVWLGMEKWPPFHMQDVFLSVGSLVVFEGGTQGNWFFSPGVLSPGEPLRSSVNVCWFHFFTYLNQFYHMGNQWLREMTLHTLAFWTLSFILLDMTDDH